MKIGILHRRAVDTDSENSFNYRCDIVADAFGRIGTSKHRTLADKIAGPSLQSHHEIAILSDKHQPASIDEPNIAGPAGPDGAPAASEISR